MVKPDQIILLDTIGELAACWGLADIAFVGGSFGSRGGQNMLEPAAYGAAVIFGPNTSNFRDIVTRLLTANAAIQIPTTNALQPAIKDLLLDADSRTALSQAAASLIQQQQGALAATIQRLTDVLPQGLRP